MTQPQFVLDVEGLRQAERIHKLNLRDAGFIPDLWTCRVLLWAAARHWPTPISIEIAAHLVTSRSLPLYWVAIQTAICQNDTVFDYLVSLRQTEDTNHG